MTPQALHAMIQDFRAIIQDLDGARDSLTFNSGRSVSTRNISIAITEMENAKIWARRAMVELGRDNMPNEELVYNEFKPKKAVNNCLNLVNSHIPRLKAELKSGSRKNDYRGAIRQIVNHLTLVDFRLAAQNIKAA